MLSIIKYTTFIFYSKRLKIGFKTTFLKEEGKKNVIWKSIQNMPLSNQKYFKNAILRQIVIKAIYLKHVTDFR